MIEAISHIRQSVCRYFRRESQEAKLADHVAQGKVPAGDVRVIKDVDEQGKPVYNTDTDALVELFMRTPYRYNGRRPRARFGRR